MRVRSTAASLAVTTALVAWAPVAHADCQNVGLLNIVCDSDPADETGGIDDDRDLLGVLVRRGATVTNPGDEVIRLRGLDATVIVNGSVGDDDRGIRPDEDGFEIIVGRQGQVLSLDDSAIRGNASGSVTNFGTISAFGDTIRLDEGGITIVNGILPVTTALIEATGLEVEEDVDDEVPEDFVVTGKKGIRARGDDTTIVNVGTIEATGEGVEGRDGFRLLNSGRIEVVKRADEDAFAAENKAGVILEDGVQFGDGVLRNFANGEIIGRDDGVDVDSGLIVNRGLIETTDTMEGAGIDVDEIGEDDNPAPTLEIRNFGAIRGAIGILFDEASTAEQQIFNAGVIEGVTGPAIRFAPGQGASTLTLADDSEILGDVIFGGAADLLVVEQITSGVLINSTFDGGPGTDTADLTAYLLSDVSNLVRRSLERVTFDLLAANGDLLMADFTRFEQFDFADGGFAIDDLTPIPVPPALPFLGAALAGLALLRSRKA